MVIDDSGAKPCGPGPLTPIVVVGSLAHADHAAPHVYCNWIKGAMTVMPVFDALKDALLDDV